MIRPSSTSILRNSWWGHLKMSPLIFLLDEATETGYPSGPSWPRALATAPEEDAESEEEEEEEEEDSVDSVDSDVSSPDLSTLRILRTLFSSLTEAALQIVPSVAKSCSSWSASSTSETRLVGDQVRSSKSMSNSAASERPPSDCTLVKTFEAEEEVIIPVLRPCSKSSTLRGAIIITNRALPARGQSETPGRGTESEQASERPLVSLVRHDQPARAQSDVRCAADIPDPES
mmetsp:Transcript_14488/g.41260  ORF Transcript_14488/g.41260 Transcript_14488/m.41260 type:complete len:232 (+) Transcript_14488:304-999(+)